MKNFESLFNSGLNICCNKPKKLKLLGKSIGLVLNSSLVLKIVFGD